MYNEEGNEIMEENAWSALLQMAEEQEDYEQETN